jgi:hypothetical protein
MTSTQKKAWRTPLLGRTQALTCLNDGGRWVIPRSLTIVTAYPSRKAVQIKDGVVPDPSIRRVIREMGWEIEVLCASTQTEQ